MTVGNEAPSILPAVIFASISTLESAGMSSSGNSTLSWIGMLQLSDAHIGADASTHPWPTIASCFMLLRRQRLTHTLQKCLKTNLLMLNILSIF